VSSNLDASISSVATAISALTTAVNDVATDVEIIRKVETGRWKITANQMIFYDEDGITPLLTFNLYDQSGSLSMEDVFERRGV
jgi:hypothetical protein